MKEHTTYTSADGKEFFDREDCEQHEIEVLFTKLIEKGFTDERNLNKKEKAFLSDVALIFANNITEFMQRLHANEVSIKNVNIVADRYTSYEDFTWEN